MTQNRDSDGTRSAETACPAPVPKHCQARAESIAQRLQALGCPYPHSDIQSSLWLLKHAHDNDLFKHSRELCDRFPELLKREAIR